MFRFYPLLWTKGFAGILLFVLSSAVVTTTSTDTFCLSCHEMRPFRDELLLSPHAKDAEGQPIGCAQCHIPNSGIFSMLGTKAYMGVKDTWVHFTDATPAMDRKAMSEDAAESIADSNCLTCHSDLMLNAKGNGPVPVKGKKDHETYLKNNPHPDRGGCARCHGRKKRSPGAKKVKVEIKSCISCHQNIAHKPYIAS